MHPLNKIIISLVSYIILGWFVCQPLTDIGRHLPYQKMSENGHELSSDELNAFLNIWSKMMVSRYAENFDGKSLQKNGKYPRGLKTWLNLQYWDINRFFYDEQRIRDLLKYSDVKHHLEDNQKITRSSNINLTDHIQDLKQTLNSASLSKKEFLTARTNFSS